MIDCSHGNSGKDPGRQPHVAREVGVQLRAAAGAKTGAIAGVMLESHLVGGRQDPAAGRALTYGQSITDACVGWEDSHDILETLAEAVRQRRLKAESETEAD